MALGPASLKERSITLSVQAEAVIDQIIKKSTKPDITIDVSLLPREFSVQDWPALKSKYLNAGWKKATWESDQRDGDYIRLQA